MLRRYHGKLSTAELKRYPTTLEIHADAKQIASDDKSLAVSVGSPRHIISDPLSTDPPR